MLKGIPPVISPDLMFTLMNMGHGDEIVLADGNFPADSHAQRIVRADGNPFIAAAFVRDHMIHASIGIPGLKDLPWLGYLFGEQYSRYEQEYCVLRASINFVQQNRTKRQPAEKVVPENPRVTAFVNRVMSEVPAE